MKRYFLLFILGTASLSAVRNRIENVTADVIFLPSDQASIYQYYLESVLDGAKSRVLMAMYWLTYEPLVNKLIELSQRGVDIKIIVDQSLFTEAGGAGRVAIQMKKLIQNGIVPLVSFTKRMVAGAEAKRKMHNKFMVVDNNLVWTGSGNFTRTVLDPNEKYNNDENIVILHSPQIATAYGSEFARIGKEVFEDYIAMAAQGSAPAFDEAFIRAAYSKYSTFFIQAIHNPRKPFTQQQMQNLARLFPAAFAPQGQMSAQVVQSGGSRSNRPATHYQQSFLASHGIDAREMSYDQAYAHIGTIMDSMPAVQESGSSSGGSYSSDEEVQEPATPKQINYLRQLGYTGRGDLTKQYASSLIGTMQRQGR